MSNRLRWYEWWFSLAGAMVFVIFLAWVLAELFGNVVADPVEQVRCVEDMACWDCETMGNLICGPQN